MDPRVVDSPDRRRFEIYLGDELAGWSQYTQLGEAYVFVHTEIDDRFAGQGLGSVLVKQSLDALRERGIAVVPLCPFVRSYIAGHPEYHDLVPEQLRDALDPAAN